MHPRPSVPALRPHPLWLDMLPWTVPRKDRSCSAQEQMNRAVEEMDVQGANEAYLRLSQIVGNTERHIRDNVDEQGRLNWERWQPPVQTVPCPFP